MTTAVARGRPSTMASMALCRRLSTTCWSCTRSPRTMTGSGSRSSVTVTCLTSASPRSRSATSRMTDDRSRLAISSCPLRRRSRKRSMTSRARRSSLTISERIACTCETSGGDRAEHAPRRLRVGHDRGQRLIELVRERRRQLADGGHAADVRQLLPHPLHVELGAAKIGDVGTGHDRSTVRPIERIDDDRPPARRLAGSASCTRSRSCRAGPGSPSESPCPDLSDERVREDSVRRWSAVEAGSPRLRPTPRRSHRPAASSSR